MVPPNTNALILSGGGARAAYQVGVLTALKELLPADIKNPFPIICGTSAGALNSVALATHCGNFSAAVDNLNVLWRTLDTRQVFRTDILVIISSLTRLLFSMMNEGVTRGKSISMLDNSPLKRFIKRTMNFAEIKAGIDRGDLKGISVSAMNYSSGESVSFFQGVEGINEWKRHRRIGIRTELGLDHLLASSAIPVVFPATKINGEYYGDGAMRQLAPISSALHMGADRVFVIGVSNNNNPVNWRPVREEEKIRHAPSIAQVVSHLFSAAFIDSLEGDLEHLDRINALLEKMPIEQRMHDGYPLRKVESLVISPSRRIDRIAARCVRYMPLGMRMLMSATGGTSKGGGASTSSYVLFEKAFIDELIELGYQDTMWERDRVHAFFQV